MVRTRTGKDSSVASLELSGGAAPVHSDGSLGGDDRSPSSPRVLAHRVVGCRLHPLQFLVGLPETRRCCEEVCC